MILETGQKSEANRRDRALDQLGSTLDRESYEWLTINQAEIANALETAVAAGATLDEIKRRAWNHTGRFEIVKRIESAARYLLLAADLS